MTPPIFPGKLPNTARELLALAAPDHALHTVVARAHGSPGATSLMVQCSCGADVWADCGQGTLRHVTPAARNHALRNVPFIQPS